MFKMIFLGLFLFVSLYVTAFGEDLKQKDSDRVEKRFKKMVRAYKNENIKAFFANVSERGFEQDFLGFFDEIQEDFRVNDVLNIDIWVDKITTDKNRRFLSVKWTKTYLSTENNIELTKDGSSVFLFEKRKKKYKLIDFKGAILFGES